MDAFISVPVAANIVVSRANRDNSALSFISEKATINIPSGMKASHGRGIVDGIN